ncbi:DUF2239 family protein [Blastomonas sp. SL216]|uniref:DUF2239 family protein n=1 Tax=Blastomonas sp. SL216 TaxID=2995169 RepID=UPI002377B7C2|nr:DUF2239 family protein [Blastomonas sp. SL216]
MSSFTAFLGGKQIASGSSDDVVRAIRDSLHLHDGALLVFDDETGRVTDLDYRAVAQQGAGRPRLGVKAREVTLLPRHWEWLSGQPGGASAALRRLVDAERSKGQSEHQRRDAVYRFMQAACGDMPGYEEALRALYAARREDFLAAINPWPADMVRYIARLLTGSSDEPGAEPGA